MVLTFLIKTHLVAEESVMSVILFECRILDNITFWIQKPYYLVYIYIYIYNILFRSKYNNIYKWPLSV